MRPNKMWSRFQRRADSCACFLWARYQRRAFLRACSGCALFHLVLNSTSHTFSVPSGFARKTFEILPKSYPFRGPRWPSECRPAQWSRGFTLPMPPYSPQAANSCLSLRSASAVIARRSSQVHMPGDSSRSHTRQRASSVASSIAAARAALIACSLPMLRSCLASCQARNVDADTCLGFLLHFAVADLIATHHYMLHAMMADFM